MRCSMSTSIEPMNAAHPSAIRLTIVNRSSEPREVKVSPWGEVVSLGNNSQVTVGQAVADVGYFEIETSDMGIFVHAWPTTTAEISTASGIISLDPQSIAPQSTAGRAAGWPGDSKEFVQQRASGTVAGFFITDSRPSATILKIATNRSIDNHAASEMAWITAVSDKDVPMLEIYDDHLVVIASHARAEGGLLSS